jgi:hypothetical protein
MAEGMNEEEQSPLDEPGRPLGDLAQTKRDNCAAAAAEAGGLDKVTPELLAKWEVTKAEYAEFAMDHVKALELSEVHRQFGELMLREFPPGPPNRDEYIRVLKQLMPDDWQKHVPPE